jgi:hypothetical protein
MLTTGSDRNLQASFKGFAETLQMQVARPSAGVTQESVQPEIAAV